MLLYSPLVQVYQPIMNRQASEVKLANVSDFIGRGVRREGWEAQSLDFLPNTPSITILRMGRSSTSLLLSSLK